MDTSETRGDWDWNWHEETPEWARHEFGSLRRENLKILSKLADLQAQVQDAQAQQASASITIEQRIHGARVEVQETIAALAARLFPSPTSGPPVSGRLTFDEGGLQVTDLNLTDADTGAQVATVVFDDAAGQAAAEAAPPVWTSSDPSVGSLSPAADGMSAVFSPSGTPGATLISVGAVNADGSPVLGPDGSTPVAAQGTVTVTAGPAATGSLSFSPQAQPEPQP